MSGRKERDGDSDRKRAKRITNRRTKSREIMMMIVIEKRNEERG